MKRFVFLLSCLSFLTVALCGESPFACAEGAAAQELATTVTSALKQDGVHAVVTAVPDISVQDPEAPTAVVFVSYEQAFRGSLVLRGHDAGGADIGVSAPAKVNEPAESGGHVHFVFEKGTALEKAASFTLEGERVGAAEAAPVE